MFIQEQNREIQFQSGDTIINLSIDYLRNRFDLSSPHQDTMIVVKGDKLKVIDETINCLK